MEATPSRLSGDTFDVKVRKRLVDATYLSPAIPATTPPPFDVGAGASWIPVNQLAHIAGRPERFVIIGARTTLLQMRADRAWSKETDIVEWLERIAQATA